MSLPGQITVFPTQFRSISTAPTALCHLWLPFVSTNLCEQHRARQEDVTETASSATQTSRPKVRVPACFNEPRRFPVFSVQLQVNSSSSSCIIKLDNIACSVRGAHTISLGKGVNYFPSLSKHGRPSSISQVELWVTYPGLNSS